jgi:hypothetical protein
MDGWWSVAVRGRGVSRRSLVTSRVVVVIFPGTHCTFGNA